MSFFIEHASRRVWLVGCDQPGRRLAHPQAHNPSVTGLLERTRFLIALATAADARHAYDAAGRYLLRVLERDPYDEPAQIALVASLASAGRHGHARRFYRVYCRRMREIGIEPAPYPGAQAA